MDDDRRRFASTKEVAKRVGIGRVTLERWLASGKIAPPAIVTVGKGRFRHWTAADVRRVQKYKQQSFRKGRGRKKRP